MRDIGIIMVTAIGVIGLDYFHRPRKKLNDDEINEKSNPPAMLGENGIAGSGEDINKKPPVIY